MLKTAARRALPLLMAAAATIGMARAEDARASNLPAYDPPLIRLSEILGATHYLRQLCGSGEGSLWRDQMQGLIDAENPDPERRARLVDAFNRGYQGFRSVYRTCTPAATLAISRYMEEGAKIAREVTARYGKEGK